MDSARSLRDQIGDWLPAILMMALIFWLSSQSTLPSPRDTVLNVVMKKSGHVLAYATLSILYLRALRFSPRAFVTAFFLAVMYAISDELHQSTVPLRGPSPVDVAIDTSAAAVALLVTEQILKRGGGWIRGVMEVVTMLKAKGIGLEPRR